MKVTPEILRQVQQDNMRDHNFGHEFDVPHPKDGDPSAADGVSLETAQDLGFSSVDQVVELVPVEPGMTDDEFIEDWEARLDAEAAADDELIDSGKILQVEDPELREDFNRFIAEKAAEEAAEKASRPHMPLSAEEQNAVERKAIAEHKKRVPKHIDRTQRY